MIATKETTNTRVLVGRLEREKVLSWLGVAFPLVVSAALNLWNLAQNGYSNLYYSVAVQSMIQSWHNFFFATYDAGGFITVDKPPVALWMQTISAKIFGFSSLSLLMPEALVGVAFNIKMLAAFVVLPTFYLLYLIAAPIHWSKRLLHLALGSIVVFGVALSWPLAVDLTPAAQRPWVGGSQANSVLDLALN